MIRPEQVTVSQRAAAGEWWESRTFEQRQRDWPVQSYMQLRTMAGYWRSWDGRSQDSFAATLLNAGLICNAPPVAGTGESQAGGSQIPMRRVPRLAEIGNGLYVRVGVRK